MITLDVAPAAAPIDDAASIERGRRLVWTACALLAVTEIAANGTILWLGGPERTDNALFRMFTSIPGTLLLLRGYAWARWLTVTLLTLGLLVSSALIGALFRDGQPALALLLVAISVGYLAAGLILARSSAVTAFFRDRSSGSFDTPDRREAAARRDIALAFGLLASLFVWMIVVAYAEQRPDRVPGNLVGVAALGILGVLTWRGHSWSRWLVVMVALPFSFIACGVLIHAIGNGLDRLTGPIAYAFVASFSSVFLLTRSRAVRAYLAADASATRASTSDAP